MTTLGQPIQWRIAEYFTDNILKPWLENTGFSRKSCPEVIFESPDTNKKEEGDYWIGLVNAKVQSPQQACDHLGLEYDEKYWADLEQKQQEQFQQKLDASKEAPQKTESKPETTKEYDEWIVRRPKHH
jgi:hypothetical protein